MTGGVLSNGEGVWDGYTGYWLGLLFCFFFFLNSRLIPRGEGVEGLLGVGGVHHDEICRYPRLCYVSHVLCAIKDSNADY